MVNVIYLVFCISVIILQNKFCDNTILLLLHYFEKKLLFHLFRG